MNSLVPRRTGRARPAGRTLLTRSTRRTPQQIGAEIGRGGFAIVFQALNVNTGEIVAIKRFPIKSIDDESLSSIEVSPAAFMRAGAPRPRLVCRLSPLIHIHTLNPA